MKIAIIGGSGFVGTKLIELLLQDGVTDVINIDKVQSDGFPLVTVIADVRDRACMDRMLEGVDLVVLLAAEHRDDVTPVSLYYQVNVEGMKNVLESMEVNGINRIIFTSSVAVYGLNKPNADEKANREPFNHYGKSKMEAEQVLERWFEQHKDWNIMVIRPTVIFGESNRGNVYNLLKQIATGKFLMIGKGRNYKSMSYIHNIIAFIQYLILEGPQGYEIFNYSDSPDFSTNDLVYHTGRMLGREVPTIRIPYWFGMLGGYGFDCLAFLTGRKFSISSVRVKKFCASTQFDSSKVFSSGFVAPFTLEEGLRRTLECEFIGSKGKGIHANK